MDLRGVVAVVTGAGHRVGEAIALELAAAGSDVFIHYNRSEGPAEETAAAARELGVRAATGRADLADPVGAAEIVDAAASSLGPVSVLVNSASGFPEDTVRDVSLDGWRRAFAVTLEGPVFLTQALARHIGEYRQGAVVNVTDVRTATPYKKHFSYVVAKGALDTFTRAAAVGLGPNMRVNAVALGVILPPPGEDDDYAARLAEGLPLQRAGGTGPVVRAVRFLLEDDFVTGEIVRVDGGGHLV